MAVAENNTKNRQRSARGTQNKSTSFVAKYNSRPEQDQKCGEERTENAQTNTDAAKACETETSFRLRASHKNKTQKNSQISTYHREKDAKSTQRETARRNIQLFTSIQTTTRQTEAMDHKATLKQSNGGALCGSR